MKYSEYINNERRIYSMYTLLNRAICSATDGLKPGARRILWTARDGKKYKSATLAGATMPIHPHASPETTINTITAPYGNNIPLLKGSGSFGTLLNPKAYGASRYTSVQVSDFTKDVIFADMDIVPMVDNYDGTLREPKHFLPLIPIALLNPSEGTAVGFASNILPRSINDIIEAQIQVLTRKRPTIENAIPTFIPTGQIATEQLSDVKWAFTGLFRKEGTSRVKISSLPYGKTHEKFIEELIELIDQGVIKDFEDRSKNYIDITVQFNRGDNWSRDEICQKLKLITTQTENLNVLTFDGESVWSTNYQELIQKFTEWRLQWYKTRYQHLKEKVEMKIQRQLDILQAIKKNIGGAAKKIASRGELKELLEAYGIVYVDYIADLPVYRFTEEEKQKVEKTLEDDYKTLDEYNQLLSSVEKRKKIYVSELRGVLRKYGSS